MANIFAFFALVSLVLFIVGLFSPKTSLFWFDKERTVKKSAIAYGGLLFLFFILFSAVNKPNLEGIQENKSTPNSETSEPAFTSPNQPTIDQTLTTPEANNDNYSEEDQKMINKIKAKAKRDWPNDYTVQKMTFDQAVEDYLYMKTVTDLSIKRKVQRDWPMDFTVQKMMYDQEVDAKEQMK